MIIHLPPRDRVFRTTRKDAATLLRVHSVRNDRAHQPFYFRPFFAIRQAVASASPVHPFAPSRLHPFTPSPLHPFTPSPLHLTPPAAPPAGCGERPRGWRAGPRRRR